MRIVAKLSRRQRAASLAVPVAIAMALPAVPAAQAQLGSSGSVFGSLSSNWGPGSSTSYLDPENIPTRTPIKVTDQDLQGLPEGVSVDRVEWIRDRWVNVYINSAAMPDKPVKVQILLARDWHSQPDRKFPAVWALDGLRARDDESGWTLETNIANFYADKNVNVVLPVGGNSSFYTDWLEEDQGVHHKWETFLTQELPAVLREGWRTTEDRALVGLSMGGTAAMNLATRFPHMWKFVGSFSGYLDTTSYGMPEAIGGAVKDGNGGDATKMWGPYGSQGWIDHDPKLAVDQLKDMTVYVSAGNGNAGQYDEEGSIPGMPTNMAGFGLEAMSRMTSETFVQAAARAGVPVVAKFRPSGTHSWPYWQYEMSQAWPYIADALNIPAEDRGATCTTEGAIAHRVGEFPQLGACISGEYAGANGGVIQDFRGGRAYWSPTTPDQTARFLWGAIGGLYTEMGATESWLGYPLSEEITILNGAGRFEAFEHGNIYWSHATGAVAVKKDFIDKWGEVRDGNGGWENGPLGMPTAPEVENAGGSWQSFQNGVIVRKPNGQVEYVRGAIAAKYVKMGGPMSAAGWPTSGEIPLAGGAFSSFDNGNIYWSPSTNANFIKYGQIFDTWGANGWENGKYGYPTADTAQIPSGGEEQQFQNGTIRLVNGQIQEQ